MQVIGSECSVFLLTRFHDKKKVWRLLIIAGNFFLVVLSLYLHSPIHLAVVNDTPHTNWMGSDFIFSETNCVLHYLPLIYSSSFISHHFPHYISFVQSKRCTSILLVTSPFCELALPVVFSLWAQCLFFKQIPVLSHPG